MPDPISIKEAASKNYVDNKFNDPSTIKSNNSHPDICLNYKNIINVGLIEVNHLPEYGDQSTSKYYVDYVDKKFNDPSMIKNLTLLDFNDKNLDNVRFIEVNSFPVIPEHITARTHNSLIIIYIDQAISYSVAESCLLRLDPDEQLKLNEQDSIFPNSTLTSPKTVIELPTKAYISSLHESNRNRPDLSSVFNDQVNEFDKNKLTNLDSVTVNRKPTSENELSTKKNIEDELDKNTTLRFNQTLQNNLKLSIGIDTNILSK